MELLSVLAKISLKAEIEHFPAVCYFIWKLEFVSNINRYFSIDSIHFLTTLMREKLSQSWYQFK